LLDCIYITMMDVLAQKCCCDMRN
jgi:hypothetical protein